MVNSALEKLLGWKVSELVGQFCHNYICCQHPSNGTFLCQNLYPLLFLQASINQGQPVYYQDIYIQNKSGQHVEVSASFAPLGLSPSQLAPGTVIKDLKSALPNFSILLLRDVTELKRLEQIKVEFIAAASHQLRTPLTSIKTASGLLQDFVGDDFSRPMRSLLNNIQSSSARLERLVNDLIQLTQLQSGRVQMVSQMFEARELVSRAVESSRKSLRTNPRL